MAALVVFVVVVPGFVVVQGVEVVSVVVFGRGVVESVIASAWRRLW